jgi:cell division protein FtsI (penicillin-binding protein 3)
LNEWFLHRRRRVRSWRGVNFGEYPVADQPTNDWRTTLKRRLTVTAAVVLLWSCAIEARLVYLQVFERADLAMRAKDQQESTLEAPAKRGDIFDRNGHLLAYSVDAESVYGVPSEILDSGRDPAVFVAAICGALDDCTTDERKKLIERFSKRGAFAYVRRQIDPEQVKRIAALELEGVGFMKENRRYYPNKELAAHVLGYAGLDNKGLAGIEGTYDKLVRGEPGKVLVQTDAHRRAFGRVEKPPTVGASLELTIDEQLQHVVERELAAGVRENAADGGAAIVMDPWTGEILALANYPTFNPNTFKQFSDNARRNRAIQDIYEPGSTFKLVTASAALEQKVVRPDDLIDVSGGMIRFGSRVIHDTHNYGILSFTDVIVKSSNVGAIRVGLRLGPERLDEYVRKFGFGRRSSPDFPGETPGIVWKAEDLKDSALASVSMGYQVGVTPLQMAAAASSIANGGELLEPRVVRAVIRNGRRLPVPRKVVRRTVTKEIAAELTPIMEKVVTDGTGRAAQIDGYTIAGKTGTAAQLVNGNYSTSDYNASFVGFLPSRTPVFTIIVVIDAPHAKGHTGGVAAAPVFKRIADAALRHRGIPPNINPQPPILVTRHDRDVSEEPISGPGDRPAVVTVASNSDVYPDLFGMSARDALRTLGRLGVSARLIGNGLVVDQQPPAGVPLDSAGAVTLRLQRRLPTPPASAAVE